MTDLETPQKLAEQTYPTLQEFLNEVARIVTERRFKALEDTRRQPQSVISPKVSNTLLKKQASSMTDVLNQLYCPVDSVEFDDPLSPEARVVLRSVTGSASYFASIFLPVFYERSLLCKLAYSRNSVDL